MLCRIMNCCLLLSGCFFFVDSGFSAEETERTQYDVLSKNDQVYIMVDAPLLVYPENTTMTGLLTEWATKGLTEAGLMQLPEYLIIKRLQLSVAGDLDGILSLYADDESSQEDAMTEYGDIEDAQATDELVDDIVFNTKAVWGPYVRIHYKRESEEMYIPPWAAYLKLINGEYRFTNMIEGAEFFNAIVDACPYWDAAKFATNTQIPIDFNRIEIYYEENGLPGFRIYNDNLLADGSMVFGFSYSDIDKNTQNDPQVPIFKTLLDALLGACTAGNQEEVVSLYYVNNNAEHIAETAKRCIIYFKNYNLVKPIGYVPYGENEAWLYAIFEREGVNDKILRMFRCQKINNEWKFAINLPVQRIAPHADAILSMDDFGRMLLMFHENQ